MVALDNDSYQNIINMREVEPIETAERCLIDIVEGDRASKDSLEAIGDIKYCPINSCDNHCRPIYNPNQDDYYPYFNGLCKVARSLTHIEAST